MGDVNMNILKWIFDWNYKPPKEKIMTSLEYAQEFDKKYGGYSMEFTGSLFRCGKCGRKIYSDATTDWKWKHMKKGIKHRAIRVNEYGREY